MCMSLSLRYDLFQYIIKCGIIIIIMVAVSISLMCYLW